MTEQSFEVIRQMPVIAILRGLTSRRASDVGLALVDAGFKAVEVPLNRPGALEAISILSDLFGDEIIVGAGTVLTTDQVEAALQAGAKLMVSPNTDVDVIAATKLSGLLSIPGFSTATEAFAAIKAGADGLKLFPFNEVRSPELKALGSVLPVEIPVFCVGGVTPETYGDVIAAGASGVGLGGSLFKPNYPLEDIQARAAVSINSWNAICRAQG